MKLTRRFLALLLAFSMSLSMVTPAFASETETEPAVEETAAVVETEAAEVVETEASETETEAPETEAPVETEEATETEASETEAPVETEEITETEAPVVVETVPVAVQAAANEEVVEEPAKGTLEIPEVLTEMAYTYIEVSLEAGNEEGYYYSYEASSDGCVTLYFTDGSNTVADIVVTNTTTEETKSLTADGVDNYGYELTVDVSNGDTLIIQVVAIPGEDGTYAEAALTMVGNFTYPVGSQGNPITPEWEWNGDYSVATATVTVPGNTTYYFYGMDGMYLAIDDADPFLMAVPAGPMGGAAVTFTIVNPNETEQSYVLVLSYPLGSSNNPADLAVYVEGESWDETEGLNLATVSEGSRSGYAFRWIAPKDGELTITMSDGKVGWSYVINNLTTYGYGYNHYSYEGEAVASETVTVAAGDEIQLLVNSCGADENDYFTPAGEIYFDAYFAPTVGIESNPRVIGYYDLNWNANETEGTGEILVPAGTEYYVGMTLTGKLLSISGGAAYEITDEGPVEITGTIEITGSTQGWQLIKLVAGEEDTPYTVTVFEPAGTWSNPAVLAIGANSADVPENSWNGYLYQWVAEDRGELTITMGADVASWSYVINNQTSFIYGEKHESDDETVVSSETVSVNKGDIIQISINTAYDDKLTYTSPAGTVTFTAGFVAAEGTENAPIEVYDEDSEDDEYYYSGNAPAYASVYHMVSGAAGMVLVFWAEEPGLSITVDGEIYECNDGNWIDVIVPGNPMMSRMPVSVVVNNPYDYEVWYDFTFVYPYGSVENPAELLIGKNSVSLEAGDSDGYNYALIAQEDGYMTITMTSKSNWIFAADVQEYNPDWEAWVSTYEYGDIHYCTDGVKSQTVYVKDGQRVALNVGTEDWGAGTINFTATFVSKEINLLSGKSTTLKFTNPDTGAAVSGTKATWEITDVLDAEGNSLITEENPYTNYASINTSGKITAKALAEPYEPVNVIVEAALKADETVTNTFVVCIYPPVTKVTIYTERWNDETEEYEYEALTDGQTLKLDTNEGWPALVAITDPANAQDTITWKSSNSKLVYVESFDDGYAWAYNPRWDAKHKTSGSATITATAADGSGKKATVKYQVVTSVNEMEITSKTGAMAIGSGKSLNMVANVNKNATNKMVTWSIVEGDEYATINATNGKLTATKDLTLLSEARTVTVKAVAKDGYGMEMTADVTILPVANKVVIEDVPSTIDFYDDPICPVVTVLNADGDDLACQDVKWTSSNKKIAEVVTAEVYDYNLWQYVEKEIVQLNGKTGKVTLTATATDGSGKKASVTLTVVKAPTYIEMPMEAVVAAGTSLTLKPTVYETDASNKKLIWTISDNEIKAKVVNGKVSADKKLVNALTEPVTLSVTATAQLAGPWMTASASCDVTFYPATTKVSILNRRGVAIKSATLETKETILLSADDVPDLTYGVFEWKSSNEKIAVIHKNRDGSIRVVPTGEKTGNVTITATAQDGTKKSAKVTIKVVQAVETIELKDNAVTVVAAGKALNLAKQININPSNATNKKLNWEIVSENTIGAKINKTTGVLTTYKDKSDEVEYLDIKVTAQDGYDAEQTLTVAVYPAQTKKVTIMKDGEPLAKGTKLYDTMVISAESNDPDNTANVYTWSTSNKKIAEVEVAEDGTVTVKAVGTSYGNVTIYATAVDGTNVKGSVSINVPKPVPET